MPTTIQLRASESDRDLIDQAAAVSGMNRTQFMLNSALKDAKITLLEETSLFVNGKAFNTIIDWLNNPSEPSAALEKTLTHKSKWDQ